jgi:acetyltransferase-like isoleucine patch superfamily enzyme
VAQYPQWQLLSPGRQSCLSSFVCLDDGVHIGLNATVREGLRLGACSTLGMGSVLLKDMANHEVWVGNPARFLRKAD